VQLGAVEGETPLAVVARFDRLALPQRGVREHPVRRRKDQRVLLLLRERQELLCQRASPRHLTLCCLRIPESPQRREELRRGTDLSGQLARPGVDASHRLVTLTGPQRGAEHDLQGKFLPGSLVVLGQTVEDLYSFLDMLGRFDVGGALQGALSGSLPVRHCLRGQACLGVVVRDQLGLRFDDFGRCSRRAPDRPPAVGPRP
jgi:hypothetical protein